MLQFDWEEVEGATIRAVLATRALALSDGSLSCREMAFVIGERAVILRVNADTDEVVVSLERFRSVVGWQPLRQYSDIVSRTLGWCWVGRNYRGYKDTFTIAMDGIDPAYSFTGVASSLHCARIRAIVA